MREVKEGHKKTWRAGSVWGGYLPTLGPNGGRENVAMYAASVYQVAFTVVAHPNEGARRLVDDCSRGKDLLLALLDQFQGCVQDPATSHAHQALPVHLLSTGMAAVAALHPLCLFFFARSLFLYLFAIFPELMECEKCKNYFFELFLYF
jgi:hypothetical protein